MAKYNSGEVKIEAIAGQRYPAQPGHMGPWISFTGGPDFEQLHVCVRSFYICLFNIAGEEEIENCLTFPLPQKIYIAMCMYCYSIFYIIKGFLLSVYSLNLENLTVISRVKK